MALLLGLGATGCADYAALMGPSRATNQLRAARSMVPQVVSLADDAPAGSAPRPDEAGRIQVRVFKVRVWAAADYRAEVRDWQARFRRLVEGANQRLGPAYGVRLEVVAERAWPRSSSEGTLDPLVDELANNDPGEDVDWVVGLATALPRVSGSIHDLGRARILGRHLVLRNMSDLAEWRAIEEGLDLVAASDRAALLAARKEHKELVVFLHELGHTLGALHVEDDRSVMSPRYDESQHDVSPQNGPILAMALRHRAQGEGPAGTALRAELREYLGRTGDAPFEATSLGMMKELLGLSPRPPTVGSATAPPSDDKELLRQALAAHRNGDYPAAWALLDGLRARAPGDARLQLLACDAGCRAHGEAAAITAACERAFALVPASGTPLVLLGSALLDLGEQPRAVAVLTRLAPVVEGSPEGAGPYGAMLPSLYRRAGLPAPRPPRAAPRQPPRGR